MEIEWLPSQENPRCLVLYIDKEPWKEVEKRLFVLHLSSLKNAKTPQELKEAFSLIEKKAAYNETLRLLAARSYFSSEIAQRLQRKGLSPSAAHEAIKKCKEQGLINDEEEAARFFAKEIKKGRGPHLIALKLKAKGKTLSCPISKEDELGAIKKLLGTKYKKWTHDLKEKQKVFAALKRRGFSSEIIFSAMGSESDLWQ